MAQRGSPVIHTPDRSGRPFAKRGVAAVRSTSPVAVRGAPGLGYLNHCARRDAVETPMATIATIVITRLRICFRDSWMLPMRVTPLGELRRSAERDTDYGPIR